MALRSSSASAICTVLLWHGLLSSIPMSSSSLLMSPRATSAPMPSPQTATASPSRRSRQAIWQAMPSPRTARTSWASWAAWQFPLLSVTAMASCRALTLLHRSWARTSRSTTSTAASSTAMPTSPPVWRAGTPTVRRSSSPAAAASTPLQLRLL